MVMPGDNITMTIELITPVASRRADALRHPRGRQDRRRRRRHQDPRVRKQTWPTPPRSAFASRRSITSCSTSRRATSSRPRSAPARASRARSRCPRDPPLHRAPRPARRQEVARAVRDPHAQAPARHPRADAADPRRADEARPVGGRRRRDQVAEARQTTWQKSTSTT